jgi:serine protease SohB
VDIEEVSSGKVWFGTLAMQEKLIDGITTSDEYLDAACARADVFEIKFEPKKSLQDRLAQSLEASFDRVLLRWWGRGIQVAPSLSERET